MFEITSIIAKETGIDIGRVTRTVELLDADNTVPFIARYRKEMTGGLDEVQIRDIEEKLIYQRNLANRKAEVIRLIDEQGKLTEELSQKINSAMKLTEVDDLYRPYRQKRKTRGSVARENGLEPLAEFLLSFPNEGDIEQIALTYISEKVPTIEDALNGAKDIIAEDVSDNPDYRKWIREYTRQNGVLKVEAKKAEDISVYQMYADYKEPVKKVPPHRILAINRGEREEYLKVDVDVNKDEVIGFLEGRVLKSGITQQLVKEALTDSYKRLIESSVERDVRNELTDRAEAHAIDIFSKNLRSLLLYPPVRGKVVLGIDPGFRTGCKVAVVDETGKLAEVGVIYPTPPHNKVEDSEKRIAAMIVKYNVNAIVIGNGTASRETELFTSNLIKKLNRPELSYTIVSEAGASVYSASKTAAAEFPDLDVTERGAVSIARRIQDPLAELVKIEPKAIGVGQYQHDITPKLLDEKLTFVVESVVNYVGVDLNTASASLLSYVSGIKPSIAENIVKHRWKTGRYNNRQELLKVSRLGPKVFEQSAGFLRILDGNSPLDATPIHPESYEAVKKMLQIAGINDNEIGKKEAEMKLKALDLTKTAQELGVGLPTLKDIVEALSRPQRDPREELPPPIFRTDILGFQDLYPGMQLTGTVRNVVDFGAFVDIGIKNDGLVHISELSDKYVRHPLEVLSVGDIVEVRVLSIDKERGRVSLSMKSSTN
ncbi:MAG: Tex family protein [Acidobacteriota bacterium]